MLTMSFEETTNLCEYDEFDSDNEKTYQETLSSDFAEYGVPLNVELSESLSKSQTLIDKQIYNCFIKTPEIFLRFNSGVTSVADSISDALKQNESNNSEKIVSFECKENDNVIKRDDCVELQYENEFEKPNGEIGNGNAQVKHKRSNSLDYEELSLKGSK